MILTSAFDPREHDFDPARRTKLERLYAEFAALVHEHGGDLDDIMQGEVRGVRRVVQFLRDIGKLWCDTGRSRQDYAELINSIWHRSDHWRTCCEGHTNNIEAKDDLVQMLELAVCRRFPDSPPAEELVFNFLRNQKINPFYIPPIEELGKLRGGYALVKAISARGGLKKFRKSYADYIYKTHPEWFQ